MLKTIGPMLNADVLYALRAMGHGVRLVVCDTNFPADSIARQARLGKLVRIDNVSAARAVRAVLSVLPLHTFLDDPAIRMEIVGNPNKVPAVQSEGQAQNDPAESPRQPPLSVRRPPLYYKTHSAH